MRRFRTMQGNRGDLEKFRGKILIFYHGIKIFCRTFRRVLKPFPTLLRRLLYVIPLAVVVFEGLSVVNHRVDDSPVRDAANVAVVDEEVRLEFPAIAWVIPFFFVVVPVDCIERDAALFAPFDSLVEEFPLAYAPKYQEMAFSNEFFQRGYRKGAFLSDGRVAVFHDCTIEINGNNHTVSNVLRDVC